VQVCIHPPSPKNRSCAAKTVDFRSLCFILFTRGSCVFVIIMSLTYCCCCCCRCRQRQRLSKDQLTVTVDVCGTYTSQVFCTVLNASYDVNVCSCDEQMSVFDTCVSEYPCLKIFVSYIAKASTTSSPTHHPSSVNQNSSSSPRSDDHRHEHRRRRHRRSAAAASLEAPVVDYSTTSTGIPSDVRPSRRLAKVDDAETLSSSNISPTDEYTTATLVSTVGPAATQDNDGHRPTGTEYQASLGQVTGNGSEAMTSYRIARDTREAVTDYEWTPTTANVGVNHSYVAKLYRSWDDSFLPEVTVTLATSLSVYYSSFVYT